VSRPCSKTPDPNGCLGIEQGWLAQWLLREGDLELNRTTEKCKQRLPDLVLCPETTILNDCLWVIIVCFPEVERILKNILCFGDSNTWGFSPLDGARYRRDIRWTGVLQACLGDNHRVIEEGLNGRTTIFDEPLRPHRNGDALLPVLLESHRPLDLVIIMLGTNDLKTRFAQTPAGIAGGVKKVCRQVLDSDFLPPDSRRVLLVSPAHVEELTGEDIVEFAGAGKKSLALAEHYELVAADLGIHFFDAAGVVKPSVLDGIHWDADQHEVFGKAMAGFVKKIW